MLEPNATNGWTDHVGRVGIHPAKRNGRVDPKKVRLIGVMPVGTWAPFQEGFVTRQSGTYPGQAMAYLYPIDRLDEWVRTPVGAGEFQRERWMAPDFAVQNTRRFGIYLRTSHPVVVALRNACGMDVFGHTPVTFRYKATSRTMTWRVPERADVVPYNPIRERAIAQGELPL